MHVFQFMQSLSFNLFNPLVSIPSRLTIQVSKQGILQNCISCKVIQYSCKLEQSDWWLKDRLALSRLQSHLDEWEWRPLWTTLQRKMSQKCWNHYFFMHHNILWISNRSFPWGGLESYTWVTSLNNTESYKKFRKNLRNTKRGKSKTKCL